MAVCERGYLCEVCGAEVEEIVDSDLYLRYVMGEVDPETLHLAPERHILCNPTLAQFIAVEGFDPPEVGGFFARGGLDPAFVAEREATVSAAYARLRWLPESGLPIAEYPTEEAAARWRSNPGGT